MDPITLEIHGLPTPQGSKRAFNHPVTGRAMMSEQTGAKLKNWRTDVKAAALQHIYDSPSWRMIEWAVYVDVTFRFPRPAGHYGSGRNAHLLKDSAPDFPGGRNIGDIEKLTRSTHDALTAAGFWKDDSLVVGLTAWKVYAPRGEAHGARITVRPAMAHITDDGQAVLL